MVVEKPAGIAVQSAKPTEKDLVSEIKKYLGYVSTLLISILTILAGAAIIIILRYLNMGD